MKEKYTNWQESFGMAEIDGYEPSLKLQSIAEAHILGLITLKEADQILDDYYEKRTDIDNYIQDKVMLRIAIILSIDDFRLSKEYFIAIHKFVFEKTNYNAGVYRKRNVSKKEAILNGGSVIYSPFDMIDDNLTYDFNEQRNKRIITSSKESTIDAILPFISNIWQAHPFEDGNTRTTSIFLEKYLRSLGFPTDNSIFKENSQYFRNALVRNNYESSRTLEPTSEYLRKFFSKILIDPSIILDTSEEYISPVR